MRPASSPRPNVAVSPFESSTIAVLERPSLPPLGPQWPLTVHPAPEEALFSWLLRLTTRLGVPLQTLTKHSLGLDEHGTRTKWWFRPHPVLLAQINDRTGVSMDRLRGMTFIQWASEYRDDEADERWNAQQFIGPVPKRSKRSVVAVCPYCFKEDREPYLRLTWMLGWMAVCPRHATLLIKWCPTCRGRLGFSTLASKRPYHCKRCDRDLADLGMVPADPRVLQLQQTLLAGKRAGSVHLPGLAVMSWPLAVAVMDVLLGVIWRNTFPRSREQLFRRIQRDFALEPSRGAPQWTHRYGGLLILAWCLDRWPQNLCSAVATLKTLSLPALIESFGRDTETRSKLKEVFHSVAAHPPTAYGQRSARLPSPSHTGPAASSRGKTRQRPALDELIDEACQRYRIGRADLHSPNRARQLARARAWVAWRALKAHTAPLTEIARTFSRDESSLRESLNRHSPAFEAASPEVKRGQATGLSVREFRTPDTDTAAGSRTIRGPQSQN